jgi:hypothetical protein
LDMHVYWNILTMHGPINVKSPNNIRKWQIGFNSAFKSVKVLTVVLHVQGYERVVHALLAFTYKKRDIRLNRVYYITYVRVRHNRS